MSWYEEHTALANTLFIGFGVNAFCGILLFEFIYHKTRRFRDGNEERDSKFPYFRRLDAPKWARWKFYPGAMTLLFPRASFCILSLIF